MKRKISFRVIYVTQRQATRDEQYLKCYATLLNLKDLIYAHFMLVLPIYIDFYLFNDTFLW